MVMQFHKADQRKVRHPECRATGRKKWFEIKTKFTKQSWAICNQEVIIVCPDCGSGVSIKNHEIDVNGNVFPSVVSQTCGCTFHKHIKLLDWKDDNID